MSAVLPLTTSFETALACLGGIEGPAGRPVTGSHAGHRLASHFQPIFSLSHGRVVGHEALLRATDAAGTAVPPPRFFEGHDCEELLWRDQLVRTMHMANYAKAAPQAQWLFLNLHPQVFLQSPQTTFDACGEAMPRALRLQPAQIVVEVLEDAVRDDADFDAAVETIRAQGGLIALDDFGAGHSNFDRVWRLRPEIVKLDRSLVERAARDLRARRVVVQMTSLLHECGALVLMEGVETEAEAFVALEADADLVQGYFFARPQAALVEPGHACDTLNALWDGFGERWREEDCGYRERIAPYFNAIGYASALLAGGRCLEEAVQSFLELPGTEVCYLLGQDGRQVGVNQWGQSPSNTGSTFEPFRDTRGARWARRPYFRRAVAAVGKVQVTRPYRTLHGAHLCVTVSTAFRAPASQGGELHVVCGDLTWS
ncbi:EAL domain-containing protein [Methylibium sp.]|uniref:EAL domain-containing protein n=1 Tax=Methylibium sp. TaxID=2067992 RepID=UPI003D0D2C3D